MTALAGLIGSFAALLAPAPGNDALLAQWITAGRAADLPHVHAFTRGLEIDIQTATAALTLPHHHGRTEGVNTRTKMIKRRCTDAPTSPSYFLTELEGLFPLFRGQVSACPGMVLPHGSRG